MRERAFLFAEKINPPGSTVTTGVGNVSRY
jgi:hypothetical protein